MIASLIMHYALTATPCIAQHPHKHHKAIPLQSCAAPVVPMCFRDPAPDPALELLPDVRPYYITTPVVEDESGEGVWIEDTAYLGGYATQGITVGYAVEGISYRAPSPSHGAVVPVRTPEISGAGAGVGLTFLLGFVAILKRSLS